VTHLAIFDCDGTLVDSQANICLAMEEAFALAGLPAPDRHAIRRIVGLNLPQAMQALLPDEDEARHGALAADYKATYQRLRASGTLSDEPLFEGMAEAIERLMAAGWLCGVATGKSDRGLAHVLDRHGLTRHFVTLQTADRHPSKPHPAMVEAAMAEAGVHPHRTVMIGDTSFDMMMARAAGVRAIGVDWGYHDSHELTAAGAEVVLAEVAALPPYLLR